MERRRLLLWLALFGAAITFGILATSRHAPRDRVDPQSIRVTVSVDGAVRVEATDGTDLVVGTLSADAIGADATLERLRVQLFRLRSAAPKDAIGHSLLILDIHGPSVAPWRWIRWIAQAASDPEVSIYQAQFRASEHPREPVLVELPRPGKWRDVLSSEGGCAVQVLLVRRKPSGAARPHTTLLVGFRERGASDASPIRPEVVIATIESGPAGLSDWLTQRSREVSGCEAQIKIETGDSPSSSDEIPFGDVVDVMNVLRMFGLHPLSG